MTDRAATFRERTAAMVREYVAKVLPCICDDAYVSRDMPQPDCPRCQFGPEVSDLINELLAAKS